MDKNHHATLEYLITVHKAKSKGVIPYIIHHVAFEFLNFKVRNFARSRRKLHKLVTEEHPRHFLTINLTIHEKNIFEKKILKNGGVST